MVGAEVVDRRWWWGGDVRAGGGGGPLDARGLAGRAWAKHWGPYHLSQCFTVRT
jgi:hypothetical protein